MASEDEDLLPPTWEQDKEQRDNTIRLSTSDNLLQDAMDEAIVTALDLKKQWEIEQLNRALGEGDGSS